MNVPARRSARLSGRTPVHTCEGVVTVISTDRPPVALTIAGSDSGGGAGIQADLKTFTVLGVYGMSAITAVTAQNTVEVREFTVLEPELVAAQMDAVLEDIGCDAAKTGMLGTADVVRTVAERLHHHGVANVVVDPVMVAKSGDALLAPDAQQAVVEYLLPRARVVTPNLPEAAALLGRGVGEGDMADAARELCELGAGAAVVKGGHLEGDAVDVLYDARRGELVEITGPRLATVNTHGTGCTFAAAIAAFLARGMELEAAVRRAKRFVTEAIARGLSLGSGHGPTDHIGAGRLFI
ncbi:MAG: bifunctional hydroxymethylpyrimidine kinase/phosphomethylpyrimidine kinase [Armatimonadetes bacterium]|nr:bifunctional hydroxymethylpyrimidine kinase/phosphomethylpyrimidine kinase [Armatimonadota bacterium]